jgi:hypothetical protein
MKKLPWVCLLVLSAISPAIADTITSDEVASCMRANLPEETSRQDITLVSHDRAGGKRSVDGRLFWNHSEEQTATMLKIDGPRDLADGAYLSLKKTSGDELYIYIPGLNKVRRISGQSTSGQILGTDISYQDLEYLQGLAANNAVTVYGSDPIAGRDAWKLEIMPTNGDSGNYKRVESWVDKATCVSLKMDFYESDSKLRKTLIGNPETLTEIDSRWLLTEQTMTDLDEETSTVLTIHKISYDPSISRQHFHKKRFFQVQ